MPKKNTRPWTKQEITYLTTYYGKESIQQMSEVLCRSYESIQKKAQALRLTKHVSDKRRVWTEKEIQQLEKNYERYGAVTLASRLKRSRHSVRKKAQQLGLNSYVNEFLHLRNLMESFNVDSRVVHKWIDQYNLPMKKSKRGKLLVYRITAEEFWNWARYHKNILPFRQYKRDTILPEPRWLTDEILRPIMIHQHRKPIRKRDRDYVLTARHYGRPFKAIANDLGRTEYAVKHIYRDVK